jgi:hypothetical protein
MYRVETKPLRDLLRVWLEDNPERRSKTQVPPRGECYTSITDEYGCVWVGSDDAVPPHLIDRIIEHWMNERTGRRDALVSFQLIGEVARFVWRAAD